MQRLAIFTLMFFMVGSIYSQSLDTPENFYKPKFNASQKDSVESSVFLYYPILLPLKLYQNIIGPTKSDNCQMYPSCSFYAYNELLSQNLKGYLMLNDRLLRCGHDLEYYDKIIINDKIRFIDITEEDFP